MTLKEHIVKAKDAALGRTVNDVLKRLPPSAFKAWRETRCFDELITAPIEALEDFFNAMGKSGVLDVEVVEEPSADIS